MSLVIQSSAFTEGHPIPLRYTGDGDDISPPLSWSKVPDGTAELALLVDDPDAPGADPWVHWILYHIPGEWENLPEGFRAERSPEGAVDLTQGMNSWETVGYRGPAPPEGHGIHHYHFKLYALDAKLNIPSGIDKKALLDAMSGHVLGRAELVGTYHR